MAVPGRSIWRNVLCIQLRASAQCPRVRRAFHTCSRLDLVKPFLLADIGEGITECQLIQWFVQPGARVEQFDKLCEVQSDKASVEITSPFDGVVKKLYYEPDDMATTGKPLMDIDIQGEITDEDAAKLAGAKGDDDTETIGSNGGSAEEQVREQEVRAEDAEEEASTSFAGRSEQEKSQQHRPRSAENGLGSLATPAVRHLVKEHKLNIEDIQGSGKDGRVMKEDVHRHVQRLNQDKQGTDAPRLARQDRKVQLTPVQNQMFKTMTKSLNIPHFLYTCSTDMTAISDLRKRLNASPKSGQRLTHLPFVLKALSIALSKHPLLNSSLDAKDPSKPQLTQKGAHNIGVAVDTPSGLLVPVIRNVQDLNIVEIAAQLGQISDKARNNKLAPGDFSGATFTVSNIGNIGGGVVSPVISEPQVAILGVGRSKVVPAFNENGELVKREELVLSWSADHRVVDGAECARCAEGVKSLLEDPSSMLVELR